MKQAISIAAFGWRHKHWLTNFYPDDLPEDWQLSYYSNEFNAVMVPSSYWSEEGGAAVDCEQWLDSVHDAFRFYVQCQADMFDRLSVDEVIVQLQSLQPQLVAMVYDGNEKDLPEPLKEKLLKLEAVLGVAVIGINLTSDGKVIWRGPDEKENACANIACVKNELTDLREVRVIFESFIESLALKQPGDENRHESEACIVVHHEDLQAENIKRARTVLEIMGF